MDEKRDHIINLDKYVSLGQYRSEGNCIATLGQYWHYEISVSQNTYLANPASLNTH